MNQLDWVQSFVERCTRNEPIETIIPAFHDAIARLGIRYFACYTHRSDPLNPRETVLVHNYPEPWVRVYSESTLHEIDPVLTQAERSPLPFSWDAAAFRAQLTAPQGKLLAAAARFGLQHGYTVPIHLSWAPGARSASCSVVPASGGIDAQAALRLQVMACYLFIAATRTHIQWNATPPVLLSQRERQCLALVAQGKDDWAAGQLLHLSAGTVHTYVERAKQRLQVSTRTQAVVQALIGRQLSFGDVLRAQDTEPKSMDELKHRRIAARRRLKVLEQLTRAQH